MQKTLFLSVTFLTAGLLQASDGTLRPIVYKDSQGTLIKRYLVSSKSPFSDSSSTLGSSSSTLGGSSPFGISDYPSPELLGMNRLVKVVDSSVQTGDERLETISPVLRVPQPSPIHFLDQLAQALAPHAIISKERKAIIVAAMIKKAKELEFDQRHERRNQEHARLDLINQRLRAVEEYRNLHSGFAVDSELLCPFTGEMFNVFTGETVS